MWIHDSFIYYSSLTYKLLLSKYVKKNKIEKLKNDL